MPHSRKPRRLALHEAGHGPATLVLAREEGLQLAAQDLMEDTVPAGDVLREGSYGQSSAGSERLPSASACLPQAVTSSCPVSP